MSFRVLTDERDFYSPDVYFLCLCHLSGLCQPDRNACLLESLQLDVLLNHASILLHVSKNASPFKEWTNVIDVSLSKADMGSNLDSRQEYIRRRLGRESHKERECRCSLNIRTRRVSDVRVILLSNDLRSARSLSLYPRACLSLSEPINIIERPLYPLILGGLFDGRDCGQ